MLEKKSTSAVVASLVFVWACSGSDAGPPAQVPVAATGGTATLPPPGGAGGQPGGAGGQPGGAGGLGGVGQGGVGGSSVPVGGTGGTAPSMMMDAGVGTDAAVPDSSTPPVDGPLNMAPVKFEPNIKVNSTTGQNTEVLMAAHEPSGLIFVSWMGNRACNYAVSKDGGATWKAGPRAVTQAQSGSAFAGDPAIAIDDKGNLFAGCQDYASGGLGTNFVLLAHSKDQGATWSDFERVNTSLDKPWLGALGDGTVILSWLGNPGGVKRSTDFGATWSTPISLGFINHGTTMSVASSKKLVHMAYNTGETRVSYRRSTDDGATFEPVKVLAEQGQPCRSPCSPRSHPIVGSDTDPTGQIVAVTWASRLTHPDAESDDDVWVIVSTDAGMTFSDPIRVNDNTTASRQFQPWVAVDRYGGVHAVWTDLRDNGANATYYARMTDFDKGFEPNVEVTDDTGAPASFLGDYKGIDVVGRDVVVTWTDTRTNRSGDIYFARAKDAAAAGGPLMP